MTVPGNIDALLLGGQRGYQIERSLRFNSADSAYLNRTPASAGNQKTFTMSAWVKRSKLGALQGIFGSNYNYEFLAFTAADKITLRAAYGPATDFVTTQVFRDVLAWYHIVAAVDTTQATSTERVKLYVNGTQVTAFDTTGYPNQNTNTTDWNTNKNTPIGAQYIVTGPANYFDGYLTEVYWIDGQALTPSSFGETDTITGVWKPKRYSGTYGTNGFYLKFADNSGTTSTTLGKDSSGNGNNWTPNNFSVTAGAGNDSMIDTPTPYADGGNGRGNYCTGNPLHTGGTTWSNGNLDFSLPSGTGNGQGTISVATGKWYWEMSYTAQANDTGVQQSGVTTRRTNAVTYAADGNKYVNGTLSAYGATYTTSDVIGVALDMDSSSVTFYKNNVSQGSISLSGVGITYASITISAGGGVTSTGSFNFGQRAFAYTPPSGFLALNTQNLPEPSIKKPSSYMDVLTYTGTGVARNITGFGFSPDFVWTKVRSSINDHKLYDAVRGATKVLESSNTGAEGTDTQGLTAFNSDGFSLGTASSSNANGSTYVAWCWDESATPGFDIVTYTGNGGTAQTIGHNLGVAPNFIVIKNRDSTDGWAIYHSSVGATGYLDFTSGSATTSASTWNNTSPTSSVFTVNTNSRVNGASTRHVAYLWSEVAGFSKFGSYTGNGSADGPFVFCGFKPRFILIKSSSNARNWEIIDTARDTYNQAVNTLEPNNSNAEVTTGAAATVDVLSNGFKLRASTLDANGNGYTYIFAAWAESPAKYSLAR